MAETQGWTSGPNNRGTLEILWSCLATMALCVWTAVHPNIPLVYGFWSTFFERLRLMFLAIIFPEFILTSAWDEQRQAKALFSELKPWMGSSSSHLNPPYCRDDRRESFPRSADRDASLPLTHSACPEHTLHSNSRPFLSHRDKCQDVPSWSFEHAIFAVMGGFATETTYIDESDQQRTLRRILLPQGISILARTGYLPIIDVQEIAEGSKADVFAKSAVVGQCLWFALQVLGRLCQKLPVTPLETHTAIHVGCAMIIYAVWMRKPYNLSQCIVVRGENMDHIGALFNFYDISRKVFRDEMQQYEEGRMEYWKQRIIDSSRGISDFRPPPGRPILKSIGELLDEYQAPLSNMPSDEKIKILHVIAADAARGLQLLESKGCYDFRPVSLGNLNLLSQGSQDITIRRVWGGWSTDVGHEPSASKAVHALFNVLYGGFHLLAWSSFFPSTVERWLWRGSALCLVSVPLWGALWILWWTAARSRHRALYLISNGDLDIVAAPLFFVILVVYTLARCYFLIEALIGLRLLPVTAYQTVKWASFLPHVS